MVHSKMTNLSFTKPHVIANLNDFFILFNTAEDICFGDQTTDFHCTENKMLP